jgi:type I restriction enzyme S subunit
MADTAFPDTMIAARCDSNLVARGFLNHLWDGELVRRQLEGAARTTNGTFKINQTMIESVQVPCPPVELQRRFDECVQKIGYQRGHQRRSAQALDPLFASVQQRAFRGEL